MTLSIHHLDYMLTTTVSCVWGWITGFTVMGIHYLNLLLDFPNTSSLNLCHLIHFTVILMTAAHVNIHDREVIFNMSYFGVFNCMFVHFNLHTTHEAVCDSLRDLNFRNHCFTTYCSVWPLYTTIFSSILKLIYCFNMRIACI